MNSFWGLKVFVLWGPEEKMKRVCWGKKGSGALTYSLCDFVCPTHSRFAGKYRDTIGSRKEFNGELNCSESECDSTSRRLSFMKMVGLGKLKRESMADHSPQGPEEESVQEEVVEEVKPREPLSGRKTRRIMLFLTLFLTLMDHCVNVLKGNLSSAQLHLPAGKTCTQVEAGVEEEPLKCSLTQVLSTRNKVRLISESAVKVKTFKSTFTLINISV